MSLRGKCKWFSASKGYGFIIPEDGHEELFVHHTGILAEGFRTLAEGQAVLYGIKTTPKGLQAVDVRPA